MSTSVDFFDRASDLQARYDHARQNRSWMRRELFDELLTLWANATDADIATYVESHERMRSRVATHLGTPMKPEQGKKRHAKLTKMLKRRRDFSAKQLKERRPPNPGSLNPVR